MDFCVLEARLIYRASSRPTRATWRENERKEERKNEERKEGSRKERKR